MATAKKKSAKASKSAKKSSKKKAPARKPGRPKRKALTPEQRTALISARTGYRDILDDTARAMKEHGLRVDGVSAARLLSLGAREQRAEARLELLDEKQAKARAPVADAHLVAKDAVARALNDVVATVRFRARKDPTLLQAFAPLIDLMRIERSTATESGSEP
jgi:hypothetical protein